MKTTLPVIAMVILVSALVQPAVSQTSRSRSGIAVSIVDLGTLPGGRSSWAVDVNQRGQVIGSSETASGDFRAFVWENGSMIDLGTLGGRHSFAIAINSRGQIIGGADTPSGLFGGFLWDRGSMTDLGTLPGLTGRVPLALNNHGQVVGEVEKDTSSESWPFVWERGRMIVLEGPGAAMANNDRGQVVGFMNGRAFVWENGTTTDLGTLPGGTFSMALAINQRGRIVGQGITAAGDGQAVLWDRGVIRDLGTLPGGTHSWAAAVNERGQVIGTAYTASGALHAFIWEDGSMIDLGTLPGGDYSEAYAINERGQVVGISATPSGPHAFLWDSGVMTDLGTLPNAVPTDSNRIPAVNARGHVVGQSTTPSGDVHAVLWVTHRQGEPR